MQCEMCGSGSKLLRAVVEGSEMSVCEGCAKFGKVVKKPVIRTKVETKTYRLPGKEILQVIEPGYGNIIKKKREELGLKQEELAKKISEKESIIHKMESEKIEPNIVLVRKLEKFLNIQIVQQHEETHSRATSASGSEMTLGDMIKLKK